MGIRFFCPKGHKLNVKAELAGKIGICPKCGERMLIPFESTRAAGEKLHEVRQDPNDRDQDSGDVTTQTPPPEQANATLPNLDATTTVAEQQNSFSQELTSQTTNDSGVFLDPDASTNRSLFGQQEEPTTPATATEPVASRPSVDSTSMLADPSVLWYVRTEQGQTYGPAAGPVIQNWIQERRIGPSMLVWREGWSTWLEAKNVFPELEHIFSGISSETPPVSEFGPGPASALVNAPTDKNESLTIQKKIARKKRASRDLLIVLGLIAAIIVLIVCLVALLVWQKGSGPDKAAPESATPAAVETVSLHSPPTDDVRLT
ncbi:MAG: DUF4339 domain-containing protein [Planctomycetia bacterium]|nr:DUF4339 domain-containing protein [Planctomycetia bacterium]